jgi:hypothetical protein
METLAREAAFHLLSKDEPWEIETMVRQARTFFDAELSFPGGPTEAGVTPPTFAVDVAPVGGKPTRVTVHTVPREQASAVVTAAEQAVAAIGGAGFDVLVARAKQVVQIDARVEGDPRAPLVLAAVLASVLLAPIVPPDETTIFGVRGARTRLLARGWFG